MPGRAHGAAAHLIGLIVVEKLLFVRVPHELASQQEGDIGQVTDRGHPVTDFHGEVRALA